MPHLVYIITHPMSARLLMGPQLAYMREAGFQVTVISSPGADLDAVAEDEGVSIVAIPMQREISLWQDLVALWRIFRAVRRLRPEIVNASTPKAGLLGMLAAWMARVPLRVYLHRGLRLETTHGVKRFVLGATERLASACADTVVCISESLRQVYVDRGLVRPDKTLVLNAGSSNGVDTDRYHDDKQARQQARSIRELLGIPGSAPVIGFIGRLTRDKGIVELAEAYQRVLLTSPNAWLLLVGDFEEGDPVPDDCVRLLREHPQVAISAFVADPKPYYAAMDVLAFPTYREGFGNVAIEAASMELPVVGFRATGVVDAVEDGVTGTLVAIGDVDALATALARYLDDLQLQREHGMAGRERAIRLFRRETVWEAWRELYVQLLTERNLPLPVPAQSTADEPTATDKATQTIQP